MHGTDHDIDLVAVDQLADVICRLGRIGLVVDAEVLDLAPAEFSSVFLDIQLESVFDRIAERRERSGERQHQPDFQLLLLLRDRGHHGNRSA